MEKWLWGDRIQRYFLVYFYSFILYQFKSFFDLLLMFGNLVQTTGLADIDYDFPSRPGDDEDDEYDEPCPVLLKPDLHEQLDYDDPVQKYS